MRFNRKKFFDGVKERIDPTLNQGQVDGLNMFPTLPQDDLRYLSFRDTESLTQFLIGNIFLRIQTTDFKHICFRQFRRIYTLTEGLGANIRSVPLAILASMHMILHLRHILQIVRSIVPLIQVFVVNDHAVRSFSEKGVGDQRVNHLSLRTAAVLAGCEADALVRRSRKIAREYVDVTYAAKVADLVMFVHRAPHFVRQLFFCKDGFLDVHTPMIVPRNITGVGYAI